MLPLTNGTVLGNYEITGRLGAGGMGEVYRAIDQRLDRVVALKVLAAEQSANAELRSRLQREARTISSLNHPNICTLFDVGESDGITFLVMEYLEGESLAERLTRGPLPARQVARLGIEICEALDRAHRQHIVHRDLKPGNVMLTKGGLKLLDFGLAKLKGPNQRTDSNAPTQAPLTAEGSILGTLQYMSPEQLEGKEADARSDIFALGATLYEMTTGKRPFDGKSQASIIANILHEEPQPVLMLQPSAPPSLARLISQCLAKDPDQRWQTARDIALQLRGIDEAPSTGSLPAVTEPRRSRRVLMVGLGALFLIPLFWFFFRMGARTSAAVSTPRPFTHISIALPGKLHLAIDNDVGTIAVSPDGSSVVFAAAVGDGAPSLYLRKLSSFEVSPIPKTEGALNAFFSPDGTEIAFFSGLSELRKVRLNGGVPERIASSGPHGGGSWGADGQIIFTTGEGLFKVPAAGGTPELLIPLGPTEGSQSWPDYLSQFGIVLYTSEVDGKSFDEANIVAYSIPTKRSAIVVRGGTGSRYVRSTKRLLFVRDRRLWSIAFDPKTITTSGVAEAIISPALMYPGTGAAIYAVSDRGDVFLYSATDAIVGKRLAVMGRDGSTSFLPFDPRPYESPRLSADGRKLSLELVGANNDAWLADLDRATLTRVTTSFENLTPILSPDGKQVITSTHHSGIPNLFIHRTDGSGKPERLLPSNKPQIAYSWSRDGSVVAFAEFGGDGGSDISLLRLAPKREVIPLIHTRFYDGEPAFSPDGLWIAYVSDDTGRREVYARQIKDGGERIRVSLNEGSEPLWSPNGREIFFREGNAIMAATVTPGAELKINTPRKLFDTRMSFRFASRSYDVMPDGEHFVVLQRSDLSDSLRHIDLYTAEAREISGRK